MTTIIPEQQQPLPRRSASGMHSRTINAAAGVLLTAKQEGRTFTSMAIELDREGLLNSPEHMAEFERMRQLLAEYTRPADEDPIAYALTDAANAIVDDAPARQLPAITVTCPYCAAKPGDLCTSDDSRTRSRDVHQHRTLAWQNAEADGITRRIAPTQAHAATEDPCHPCGCPKRFNRHAWGCPTLATEEA